MMYEVLRALRVVLAAHRRTWLSGAPIKPMYAREYLCMYGVLEVFLTLEVWISHPA